jgi:DNA-binding SARP family transcriptional activator/tetratricopeptide (TPR) repeat protein
VGVDAGGLPGFQLKVLGGFELRRAGEQIHLSSRKAACLLAYLACTAPRLQPRERLANLLWSSGGDARSRHNLRQAISGLRRLLGHEAIVTDGKTVGLRPGVVDCDAARLGEASRKPGSIAVRDAATLYDGALLDEIHVEEPAWNDWLLAERERLSDLAVGAIVAQAEQEFAIGHSSSALALAHRAVTLNRFREDAHRVVFRALAATGRKAEAIRRYHDLTAYLAVELGAEPDDETRRLAAWLVETDGGRAPHVVQAHDGTGTRGEPGRALSPPRETGQPGHDVSRRRHVTFLVCGLTGRDGRTTGPDPEDADAVLRPFVTLASELGASFGGQVRWTPDGTVQMIFGYPAAREDDAAQAVRAGIALVHAAARLESLESAGLAARVGIATGPSVIGSVATPGGQNETLVAGDILAAAHDVLAVAEPGSVAASEATRRVLRNLFGLRRIATGSDAKTVWRVTSLHDDAGHGAARRLDAPARRVGRQDEFETLCRCLETSKAGRGRVVLLVGEPGIGKSRLVDDVLDTPSARGIEVVRYACSEHDRNRPLHPFINRLEWREQMLAARSPEERRDHVEALVRSASSRPERDIALLCDLLDLPAANQYPGLPVSPPQKREMLTTAFIDWIAGQAAKAPLVLHFEDIHWIDPSSQDLLSRVIERVADWPVLLVATMRPDRQPSWITQPHVTVSHLSRIGRAHSAELVGVVAGEMRLPDPVVQMIVERAEGVPLCINELTRHVMENRSSGSDATVPQHFAPKTMPVSLQSTLVARLDRSAAFREVALAASAIGRTFSFQLIAATVDMTDESLREALAHMTNAGLIVQTGTPPYAKYAFAHALMHEAAHGMLLRRQRQQLHSRIADTLIGPLSTTPDSSPATIARHLSEAGRHSEAVDHYVIAAQMARRRWANREAAELLDSAIAALEALTDTPETLRRAVDLRFEIKNALTPLADFDRIVERLIEARRLIDRLGDKRRLCQFLVHMSQSLGLCGRTTEAIAYGSDAETLAGHLGDDQLLTEAKVFLGTAQYTVADFFGAKASFLDVLDLVSKAPPDRHYLLAGFPDITAGALLAKTLATLGDFEEGRRHGLEAVARAAAMRQPYSQSIAQWCLGDLHLASGDIAAAIGQFESGLALAREWDLPTLVAGHTGSLGHAHVLSGNVDAGLPMLQQALAAFEGMRHHLGLSLFLVPLAAASVVAGNVVQARALAGRSLELARENGHRSGEAGARYVLAAAEAQDGEPARALTYYAEALDLAMTRGMRPLCARCHLGLGEAYRHLGDESRARHSFGLAAALHRELGMTGAPPEVVVAHL